MKSKPIDYAGDAAMLGISEERYRKGRRALARELARHKRHSVPTRYRCQGGPFDNADLFLTTVSTGMIKVRDWAGRYVSASKTLYFHEERKSYALLSWVTS